MLVDGMHIDIVKQIVLDINDRLDVIVMINENEYQKKKKRLLLLGIFVNNKLGSFVIVAVVLFVCDDENFGRSK